MLFTFSTNQSCFIILASSPNDNIHETNSGSDEAQKVKIVLPFFFVWDAIHPKIKKLKLYSPELFYFTAEGQNFNHLGRSNSRHGDCRSPVPSFPTSSFFYYAEIITYKFTIFCIFFTFSEFWKVFLTWIHTQNKKGVMANAVTP